MIDKLIEACKKGSYDIVKMYVTEQPELLNKKDIFGNWPFIEACYYGHIDIVKLIIKSPSFVSINEKNGNGHNGFMLACGRNNYEIAELIIKTSGFTGRNGFNGINEIGKINGFTVLMYSCLFGYTKIVKLILSQNKFTKLNHKNNYDCSALDIACKYEHVQIIKELLKQPSIVIDHNCIDNVNNDKYSYEVDRLIKSYLENPKITRSQLILENVIDIFHHVIFINDDLFNLNY